MVTFTKKHKASSRKTVKKRAAKGAVPAKHDWLVTSALLYVNDVPHLGHYISAILPADAFVRFLRLRGEKATYIAGTDDHGTPTEVAAIKRGITPKQLVDDNFTAGKKIFEQFGCQSDVYSQTSTPQHHEETRQFYEKIRKKGYTYEKEIEQLYCHSCKRFLPDRYVEGACPLCGADGARGDQCDKCGRVLDSTQLRNPYCVICRSSPAKRKTTHIFFSLSRLTERLQQLVDSSTQWNQLPRNFAKAWIRDGLEDRCITRDIKWGVPVPERPDKVFYVWFDAPIGYITFSRQIGKEKLWHSKRTRLIHFIGEDNIAFHTIFFPGMLLAAGGYVTPYNVVACRFLQYEGKKFSKSRRVGIFCPDALSLFPADYWRYYLYSIHTDQSHPEFEWRGFQQRVNADLNDTIGNFVHRTLTLAQKFPGKPKPNSDDRKLLENAAKLGDKAAKLFLEFDIKGALQQAVAVARLGNQYLNSQEPWKNPSRAPTVVFTCLHVIKALSVYLEPFIPSTCTRMRGFLGLPDKILWKDASKPQSSFRLQKKFEPLFRKIEEKEVNEYKQRFAGTAQQPDREFSLVVPQKLAKEAPSVFVQFSGLAVKRSDAELDRLKHAAAQEALRKPLPHAAAYDKLSLKYDRTGLAASPANLRRLVEKNARLPEINTLVDAYNVASLETGVVMGAYDKQRLRGNKLTLKLADGSEKFQGVTGAVEKVEKGEAVYVDEENNVITNLLSKQSFLSRVTTETQNACMIVQGHFRMARDELLEITEKTSKLVQRFCGGKYKISQPRLI
ncbi:methionine--tRNA ligase [Candidatus Micrarchaeota archaeon]|nr:methionine--tRNA ligase [Candidatus Micrarchaeota archaeon]